MSVSRSQKIIFLCGLVAVNAIQSFPARAESLLDAVSYSLSDHPGVKSAIEGARSADQERRGEASGYYPTISASAMAGRMYGDNATSRGLSVTRGAGYSNLWEGSITARQPVFDGFETSNRVKAAKARSLSADMNILDVRENTALRAIQAYLDVMRAHTALTMLEQHQEKITDYLNRIKSATDQGSADESEFQQARDVQAILEGFINDYKGQVAVAEANYLEVIGKLPDGDMQIIEPRPEMIPPDVESALAYVQESPAVKAALLQSKSSEHEIGAEKAQLYPDLNGELSTLKSEKDDILGGEAVDSRAVMRVNWDFETGMGQFARIKKKKHDALQAKARADDIRRQAERSVRLAYAELETAREGRENHNKRLDLNTKLFDTFTAQFEGARITLLQLMQSDNQLLNTRIEKLNAEYRMLASEYGVLASVGKLTDSLGIPAAATTTEESEKKPLTDG